MIKITDIEKLPDKAQLTLKDLATQNNQRGITIYSESTIRRMIERGTFPEPNRINGTRSIFWFAKDIKKWIKEASR
ncbi:hypothetical protein AAEX37_00989 [Oligella sp. MSHR50489EDL]|uniref:helix-turn-helix transcriptional regulator n=1 Tax=Oligella sp. MSHR50489EDL TaxID=3139409 RepID=UPI003D8162B8